jgi:O-antigen/teichoic acid export membrane protein
MERDAAGVFARHVLTLLLSFGNSVFLTRTLGVVGKGEFAVFAASTGLLTLLFGLGLDQSLRFHVARERVPRERILAFFLLQVVVAGVLVFALARVNHAVFGNELLLPTSLQTLRNEVVLAATVSATLFYGTLSAVFAGSRAFATLNGASVAFAALALVVWGLLFAVDAATHVDIGTDTILRAYLVLQGVNAAALTVLGVRILGLRLVPGLLAPGLLLEMIRYAAQAWAANLAQFLNYRVDIWIVQYLLGSAPLGLYALAGNLATMLWVLPRSAATVLLPSMAAGDQGAGFAEAARLGRVVFGTVLIAAVPLGLTAPLWIGWLYGSDFRGSAGPFLLLLLGCVPFTLCVVQAAALAAVDRQEINLAASLVGLAATVVLDLLLIPRLGITGAALASATSYVLTTGVVLLAFARVGGLPVSTCLVPRPADLRHVLRGIQRVLR